MDYPRELKLSPEREERLKQYLDEELLAHRAERSKWVDDLQAWQEQYWATPSAKEASFPWQGAANVIIPLTAIAVEAGHAREMTSLFALNQFASGTITNPDQQDLVYDLEKAVDHELINGCNIYKFADSALLENRKLGSCIGKSGYEKIIKTAVRPSGNTEVEFQVITKQGPTVHAVPLANFLMPFTATDPQIAPWCGEEHLTNFYDVESKIESGFFRKDVGDNLKAFWAQSQNLSSTTYTQAVRQEQDQIPIEWPREIGWNEIWLAFDVDGSSDVDPEGGAFYQPGNKKEIVVHYHWPSRTFFSIRYNWRSDLSRPYRIGNYFPMEHRWAGIGVGKQNEQFQEMVTTENRQRIDNATLANMKMFKAKQGGSVGPNEPFFPGKIFMVDDMADFEAIAGGSEVYPSSYNNEQQLVIYSQQRTGVNELSLGMPQSGTPGTATSDLTRVQEFNRKTDYTARNSKIFLDQIIEDVLCQQSQFGFRDRRYFDTIGPNGRLVEALLKMPCEDIRSKIFYTIQTINSTNNDIIERSNWTQYAGMLTQYYTNMFQLAEQLQQPQLMQIIAGYAMKAGTDAMKQISEGFNIRGVDRLLLPQQLTQFLTQQAQNGPPQLSSGGSGNSGDSQSNQGEGISNSPPTPGQSSPTSNT